MKTHKIISRGCLQMATKLKTMGIIVLAATAMLAVIFLLSNNCYKRRNFEFVEAIWNKKDAYVFVQTITTIEKVPKWKILFATITGMSLANESHSTSELLIFRCTEDSETIDSQSNIDIRGQLLIFDNTPHIIQGGYEVKGFRLINKKFELLNANETKIVQERIKSDKAFWLKEGWKKLDWEELESLGNNYDRVFRLTEIAKKVELRIRTFPPLASQNPRVLIEVSINGKRQTLVDLLQNHERIKKEEFVRIKSTKI